MGNFLVGAFAGGLGVLSGPPKLTGVERLVVEFSDQRSYFLFFLDLVRGH